MSCHARRRPTVCAVQGQCYHATLDVIRLCVQSKGGDVMPHLFVRAVQGRDVMPTPTSFDRVCCPRAVMSCHDRCRPTVRAIQGQ